MVEAMSKHSAKFVSQIRCQSSLSVSASTAPFVPSQCLLIEFQLKPPTIHGHWKESHGSSLATDGLRDVAHIAGPLAIIDQRCLREHNDSRKLRIVPIYRQRRACIRHGFAALKNAHATPLHHGPIEVTAKVYAKVFRNVLASLIRGMPHHVQREDRMCRCLHIATDTNGVTMFSGSMSMSAQISSGGRQSPSKVWAFTAQALRVLTGLDIVLWLARMGKTDVRFDPNGVLDRR